MLPFSSIKQGKLPVSITEATWIKAIAERLDQCVIENNQLRERNIKLNRRDRYAILYL